MPVPGGVDPNKHCNGRMPTHQAARLNPQGLCRTLDEVVSGSFRSTSQRPSHILSAQECPGNRISSRSARKPSLLALLLACFTCAAARAPSVNKASLSDGWALQSSAKLTANGGEISTADFDPAGWYKATVPSTVMGNLVRDGVYRHPFFGMNLRSIPGMDYPIGANFSSLPMSPNSPLQCY